MNDGPPLIHKQQNLMLTNQDNTAADGMQRRRRGDGEDRYLRLRNILNVIFMLGALAGVSVYFQWDKNTGTIIILVSMVFKIVECVFRFMK